MAIKFDTMLTLILSACAIIVSGLVVRREFFPPQVPVPPPTLFKDWDSLRTRGVTMGPANAPIQLVEFADFECPACGMFHQTLKTIRQRYPGKVALTFVHFPLSVHELAVPAARASECAADQGRFEAMHDLLLEQQESLGQKTWSQFATEAGVADIPAFEACAKSTQPVKRIEDGKAAGGQLIKATPTLIVNGWKLGAPPQVKELDKMVKAILAGKNPFPENNKVASAP